MLFFSWASAPRSVHVVHAFGEKELVLVLFECSQGTYLNCFTRPLPADSPSVSLCHVLHIDPPLLHSFCLHGRSSPLKRGIILHYCQIVAPASSAARIGCTFLDLQCKRCLQLFCSLKATLHVGCVLSDRLMCLCEAVWEKLICLSDQFSYLQKLSLLSSTACPLCLLTQLWGRKSAQFLSFVGLSHRENVGVFFFFF